jgi:hypothetical protein
MTNHSKSDHPTNVHRPTASGRPADSSDMPLPGDPAPGSEEQPARGRVQVAAPDGVLAVVPHLLGFHPSRSLVVLGVSGPRDQVTLAFRYDLPDPPDPDLAADIAEHACGVLTREGIAAAILVGYGPADLVGEAVEPLVAALLRAKLEIREVLRAEGGRYWSALCESAACCPAEGISFNPCSHPAAAVLNQAGLDAFPDRAALARTLEPAPGSAEVTRRATTRALRQIHQLLSTAQRDGLDPARSLARAGRSEVRNAIDRYRSGAQIADHDRLAFLAVLLSDLPVRDDAWARMEPAHKERHLRLWTDVVTGAAPEFVPAPASLLAFTAWQCGEGALANIAVERALAADPAYSLALLIAEAVQAGLPPSAARPPMTPDEVAASYAGPPPAGDGTSPGEDALPGSGNVVSDSRLTGYGRRAGYGKLTGYGRPTGYGSPADDLRLAG